MVRVTIHANILKSNNLKPTTNNLFSYGNGQKRFD